MPYPLELPGMLRAVVPLMSGERFAAFGSRVVSELVAIALRGTRRGRFSGGRAGLVPSLAAIVGALNDLPEPAAALRRIQPIRVRRRPLDVVDFPAPKVGAADIPFLALAVRRKNECALAGTN